MSEEFKNSGNIGDEDFANEIPAPEDQPKKKKGGFIGEFFSGAAKGAVSVGEGISAGIKVLSEKKPGQEHPEKAPEEYIPEETSDEAPAEVIPEEPAEVIEEVPAEIIEEPTATFEEVHADYSEEPSEEVYEGDETSFPTDEPKETEGFFRKFMKKLNTLPTAAVIGGAVAILAVLIIIILSAASCSAGEKTPVAEDPSSGEVVVDPVGPGEEDPSGDEPEVTVPTRKEQFVEAFNTNNDVVAWLYVPGLEDVDAGVCFSYDKTYPYDKRDITGKKVPNSYWIDGAYYTHFRGIFGPTSEELSLNTVIFGHSDLGKENLSYKNDDPTGPLFSQLFSFKDPSFAEKTPYIFLTLREEDTVWEVFSVFYNDANAVNSLFSPFYKKNGGSLWYIEPNPSEAEYALMIDTAKSRSIYDYDVEVTADDRILTLSTCTVAYGLNARSNYRFVIMARLVENPETDFVEKNASFTINEDAPVPDTYKEEFENYIKKWKPSKD